MKKVLLTLGVVFVASLILLACSVPVNHSAISLTQGGVRLVADGTPLPPAPPPPPPPKNPTQPAHQGESALAA